VAALLKIGACLYCTAPVSGLLCLEFFFTRSSETNIFSDFKMISINRIKNICPIFRTTSSQCFSTNISDEKVKINPVVTNRNPRNLERMRIGLKPQGFNLETPGKSFWHKYLTAFVTLEKFNNLYLCYLQIRTDRVWSISCCPSHSPYRKSCG
jgi:hypothetical protein